MDMKNIYLMTALILLIISGTLMAIGIRSSQHTPVVRVKADVSHDDADVR